MNILIRRLSDLTDAMIVGAWPPDDCFACRQLGRPCELCQAQDADQNILNGEMLPAIMAAGSDGEALAAFLAGFMKLTGAAPGEITAALTLAGAGRPASSAGTSSRLPALYGSHS